MNNHIDIGEIILYQPDEKSTQLEVRIEEETVWLTRTQMVDLFNTTKQNISLHINNIYREGELDLGATVKEYLTVQIEGSRKMPHALRSLLNALVFALHPTPRAFVFCLLF